MYKLAVFDMDGTLLNGRTIFHLASRMGFMDELERFMNSSLQPYQRTIEIAKLLKGAKWDRIISWFREIPFRPRVRELIEGLRKKDMIIAVATDSYDLVANDVKNRLGLDYAFANTLLFHDSICTGEVILHNITHERDKVTKKIYSISKSTILNQLCTKHHIPIQESIAVGDSDVDCGMLKTAGLGIAVFASAEIQKCADMATDNIKDILTYIGCE